MAEPTTSIKETSIGSVRVSTIFMENLHDFMNTLMEAIGHEYSPEAQALRATREETRDNPDLNCDPFGIPIFGPYYETVVSGGKLDNWSKRSNSITEALSVHEDMVATVRKV